MQGKMCLISSGNTIWRVSVRIANGCVLDDFFSSLLLLTSTSRQTASLNEITLFIRRGKCKEIGITNDNGKINDGVFSFLVSDMKAWYLEWDVFILFALFITNLDTKGLKINSGIRRRERRERCLNKLHCSDVRIHTKSSKVFNKVGQRSLLCV